MVYENYRSRVFAEPFRGCYLILPVKTTFRVVVEFHVVRRVGIDKIMLMKCQIAKAKIRKSPPLKNADILQKVIPIVDPLIATEGHVEQTAVVESAKSVITGSVQIVEE